ncbi:MAG: Tol-Pal system beta propeller repeat protein TolB [Betaproteobacteria bacterium]|nr:Tol-Pal system beta propeller repeat protein TolB [Betaproteobacteria bacterium]MDH5220872.1 Tol-Pal system beta propeller repeat protein TolB [Betaproteobacteria bacterium]MDH5349250.1 Tol-Pal system beta propeller repeat protein TolB [Betaproteobacteria bacterium]
MSVMRPLIAALLLLAAACGAHAQLSIEITGAGAQRIPVAIAPLAGEGALLDGGNAAISAIVRADLERSGLFRAVDVPRLIPQPTESSTVNYAEWRSRLADALVLGSVSGRPDGRFEVRFRLYDVVKQAALGGVAYTLTREQVRATAHRIADYVYEKLTGEKGVFSTRIAYVVKRGERFELQIADADGANEQAMLVSNEPIISPVWSPDGRRIAYVSFQNKKPIVYVQDVQVPKQRIVANFKGSNSAPAWSPDGARLAVALTRDGSSQLYLIDPDGGNLRRLTNSFAIDTEPFFSPDGRWIYFTSDRGGSPQIYRMPSTGGEAQRVTFEGGYNVSPRVSPDGRSLAYVTRNGGRFQVALLDLGTRQSLVLTDSDLDESPSFAPNGRQILLATILNGRGVLTAVSSDGRVKQRLTLSAGDVREPSWGPLIP